MTIEHLRCSWCERATKFEKCNLNKLKVNSRRSSCPRQHRSINHNTYLMRPTKIMKGQFHETLDLQKKLRLHTWKSKLSFWSYQFIKKKNTENRQSHKRFRSDPYGISDPVSPSKKLQGNKKRQHRQKNPPQKQIKRLKDLWTNHNGWTLFGSWLKNSNTYFYNMKMNKIFIYSLYKMTIGKYVADWKYELRIVVLWFK